MLFLLLIILGLVRGEWPPSSCEPSPYISDGNVMLTSVSNTMTTCILEDTFSMFYARITRSTDGKGSGESSLTFSLQTLQDEPLTSIELADNSIVIGSDAQCFFDSVTGESFWLRVRLQAMMDTLTTHVHVSYSDGEDSAFRECATNILETLQHQFRVVVVGETKAGMRQIVHDLSKSRPKRSTVDVSGLEIRIGRMEERLRRLHNIVTEYIESHDRHVLSTSDRHSKLTSAITETHNRIVTRSNAHGLVYVFMFFMLFVCGISYVRCKTMEEMRFHMP